jgi:3-keto-L-gulonate-6-phosphate decarboxylase
MASVHPVSEALRDRLRGALSFQISVDVGRLEPALAVARAALAAGVTLLEMGTPLIKTEGVRNVVPAFRRTFPEALLLADMKTMDGGAFEARGVYAGGGNIIDFLALAGPATARAVCAVRDEFRAADATIPRLAFADILVPQQGPAEPAIEAAMAMLEAGVDGIGIHLQLDARRADPALHQSGYLGDIAQALQARIGERASLQVVGGLSLAQAQHLARAGLRAFVISGNLGLADSIARYDLPPAEIERHVRAFIAGVTASAGAEA